MSQLLHVLIVEDNPADAEMLLRELRRGGFDTQAERVETPAAMREALTRQSFDLVISDYNLPQFSAPDALQTLQTTGLDIPFFVISGTIDEDMAVAMMRAGAHEYMMKDGLKRLIPSLVRALRDAGIRREHRHAEELLRQSEKRLSMAITSARMYTWDWDVVSGKLIRAGHYQGVHGEDASAEGTFDELLDIMHPDDRRRVEQVVAYSLQTAAPFRVDFRIHHRSGEVRWLEAQAQPYQDASGRCTRVIGVTHDISERKRAEQLVSEIAFNDPLTSLPNRNSLRERVIEAINSDAGRGAPFALLLMDLNHFKDINDTLGHHRGDLVLKEVAQRLCSAVAAPSVVARLGGDEFAILLPDLDNKASVHVVIEQIQRVLHEPVTIDELAIVVEAGIGVALYPDHGTNPDSLLRRADVAMYTAKKAGASYVVYDMKDDHHSTARLALMAELRQAIEQDRLVLHYQPKIDLNTGRICGAEALVRWQHPRRGMIAPDQFIAAAEQGGLIHPLTRWVLQTATMQCGLWRSQGLDVPMAVNLSARNLLDQQLPEEIAGMLLRHSLPSEWLTLEITESAIMADPTRAGEILQRLSDTGVRLAIDDFGIGYSSLGYLSRLPVHCLKVDRSFVGKMLHNPDDAVIVRSTIDLAHNLALEVVAEGVEDKETYDSLLSWGCDAAQGYLMSRPLPADAFTEWLRDSPWGLDRGVAGI